MKHFLSACLLFGTMLLFLLFPSASFDGAKTGLLLWFHQVLPSLLPFFILTNLLMKLGLHHAIGTFFYPLLHPLLRLSRSGCFAMITGLLSGLPLGAKTISELQEQNELSRKEALLLLPFCTNPSPMFLISYAGIAQLGLKKQPFLVFLLVLGSAFCCHFACRLFYFSISGKQPPDRQQNSDGSMNPCGRQNKAAHTAASGEEFSFSLLDACIMNGFESITKIGGYIILFNIYAAVFLAFAKNLSQYSIIPLCTLEMTTGIASVCGTLQSPDAKLLLVTGCVAFGGLSGLAQSISVTNTSLPGFGRLLLLKVLQCFCGILLAAGYLFLSHSF